MERSPITTHVLDTAAGKPAVGIEVALERKEDDAWILLGRDATNEDGRALALLPAGRSLETGTYRLTFLVGAVSAFYPEIAVAFVVDTADRHYHVPLLLSPFSYTTYRGS